MRKAKIFKGFNSKNPNYDNEFTFTICFNFDLNEGAFDGIDGIASYSKIDRYTFKCRTGLLFEYDDILFQIKSKFNCELID